MGPRPPGLSQEALDQLFVEQDYMSAYRRYSDLRVQADPHAAVGGMWDEIGALQFDYLVGQGLGPSNSLLDIGCGTLRGGRLFIAYLEEARYTGTDISQEALAYAASLVEAEGLAARRPRLVFDEDMRLGFEELDGPYDFILAQSVFTHLPEPNIEECFENLTRIMDPHSVFYFTFADAPAPLRRTLKDFSYPFGWFRDLASRQGYTVELMHDYPHPRRQAMARLTLGR